MKKALLNSCLNALFQAQDARNNSVYRFLDQLAVEYHRAFENHDFNFTTNGEARLLQHLGAFFQNPVVFDVGANCGDWSELVLTHIQFPMLHAFELCPPTFGKLKQRLLGKPNVFLNDIGLSNCVETLQVLYSESYDVLSSAVANVMKVPDVEQIDGCVSTGDDYCRDTSVDIIDVLKIDVEGMEQKVLEGFSEKFLSKKIRLVQLEYGMINIATQFLLKSMHDFFERYGYQVGKLYKTHIEFVPYDYPQEDFLGPNYIAVQKQDSALLEHLRKPWAKLA